MLVRFSLIIAILAGAAAFYFSHTQVQQKITDLNTSLSASQAAEQAATSARMDAEKARDQATEELMAASKLLNVTTNTLAEVSTRLTEQEQRANRLNTELTETTQQRNEARQQVAQFRAIGLPIEEILRLKESLQKTREEREVFVAENKILERQVNELQNKLSIFIGPDKPVNVPSGLKGNIVAVDPKYDFVVIDVGEKAGLLPNGKLLVSRNGKYIATVQVTRVQPDRSIANILREDEGAEIMEGDTVIAQR